VLCKSVTDEERSSQRCRCRPEGFPHRAFRRRAVRQVNPLNALSRE
jgi:hypothetical protein